MLYAAVEFIDGCIEGGGRCYVHCHQGVSRSSSMAIAYLMWKEGLNFDEGFTRVKTARGVCNPNAGFICRLLAFGKDIHAIEPPSPPRLYRLSPFVGGPVARSVDSDDSACKAAGGVCAAVLDPRTAYVLHGALGLVIWVGARAHPEYVEGARTWAKQLGRFERAVPPAEVAQGEEPPAFWSMLGGFGEVPDRLSAYDKDYGVGTTPTIRPPEIEVQMPVISAPLSISGSSDRGGDPPTLLPGIHTTMSAEEDVPPPSARGGETPRGNPPPMSARLGLGTLGRAPSSDAPPPTHQQVGSTAGGQQVGSTADAPPPTHRGAPPPRSFADLPRESDPLPTPRGRRGPADEDEADASAPSSKKPREAEGTPAALAAVSEEAAAAGRGELATAFSAGDGGAALVFAYPDWDEVPMFTRSDFESHCAFAVLCKDANGLPGRVVMWVGEDSSLGDERDSDIMEIGKEFVAELELPAAVPMDLMFEADADEADAFYDYFPVED